MKFKLAYRFTAQS